jgi:hypothetical protein
LSQVIVADGQPVAEATGSAVVVIDRAGNSGALAEAFAAQGLGVLGLLEDNEPAGLERWEAPPVATLEDGTRVESGPWQESRTGDPRHLVLVQPAAGTTWVSWGTPQVQDAWEAQAWPGVSRARHARHAHRFTAMSDHGALALNEGRQKMIGADRHPQRQHGPLDPSLETAHTRVDKQAEALKAQQDKGAEAASTGHGKRLEPRTRPVLTLEQACKEATAHQAQGSEHASTLGPAGQRAARDCRQQTIMTMRTRLLEHVRRAFLGVRWATRHTKGSFQQVLRRLFARSGSRMETPSPVLSWVNSTGFSLSHRRLLREVAHGLCAMGLQEKGQPVPVRLKDMPP